MVHVHTRKRNDGFMDFLGNILTLLVEKVEKIISRVIFQGLAFSHIMGSCDP